MTTNPFAEFAPSQTQTTPQPQAPSNGNPFGGQPPSDPWGSQQPPAQPPFGAQQYGGPQQTPQPQFTAPVNNAHPPTFADAPSATANGGAPDPFADPSGPGSGEKIQDMLGCLLLVKPLEFIAQMATSNGDTDAIRADIAILDNWPQPGHVADGVMVFQKALVRDLKVVHAGPTPYLIGRLARGEAKGNKSAPFLFTKATDADKHLAKQFLAARQL